MSKKENTKFDYFGYGLYAFGVIGLELIIINIVKNLYNNFNLSYVTENILNLVVTTIVWSSLGLVLYNEIPKKNYNISKKDFIISSILLILSIIYTSYMWKGLKPVIEYNNLGLINFIFQYIYYLAESFLIALIIAFGDLAFNKKDSILPLGGIFLALTWGLMHIFLQDLNTGIYCIVLSIIYGFIHINLKFNFKYTYIFIALSFLI